MTDERIVAAACHYDGLIFSLAQPARHCHVLRSMLIAGLPEKDYAQGFVTSLGRYVSREEAVSIAYVSGQMQGRTKTEPSYRLFSEDLW
jgi:hypothetical protein